MRRWKKRFSGLRKRKQGLIIVACDIIILWIILIFALFKVEKSVTDQYRAQYYDQFVDNLTAFSNIKDGTDNFCRDIKLAPSVLSFLENSGSKDLERCLVQQDIRIAEEDLFITNSRGYIVFQRLRNIINVIRNYSELVLYNPQSGVSIAVTEGGRYGALCVTTEELQKFLAVDGDLEKAGDGDVFAAEAAEYATSQMYIVRSVGDNGMLLLCGLAEKSWMDSLLASHSGRNYKTVQVCCRLQNGTWIYRSQQPDLEQIGIDPQRLDEEKSMQTIGQYTVLSFQNGELPLLLLVVSEKLNDTNVFSEKWFLLFLGMNVLWLAIVAKIHHFVSRDVFKPIEEISRMVPDLPDNSDELETISKAIGYYNQKIRQDEELLDRKDRQLRIAWLTQLIAGQQPAAGWEQGGRPENLHMPESYLLVVLYPDDESWESDQGSPEKNTHRKGIMITTIQELFRRQFPDTDMEFLIYQKKLLVILSVQGGLAEDIISQRIENGIADAEDSMRRRFCIGMSSVKKGQKELRQAYHEAMVCVRRIEEKKSGRAENIKLNKLLKKSRNMGDLIYLERYDEALQCFTEMLQSIFEQKSRFLREQQLGAFLKLTYCMLTEANETNTALLENMNADISARETAEDPEKLLQCWKEIFNRLDEFYKNKKEQKQYSKQFMKIYQYMEKNFRNPELSLSMLAEKFDMSLPTMSREFHKNLGQGFLECLHYMRIEEAKFEIEHTDASLKDIAVSVGYSNTLTMNRSFKKYTGTTPGAFRKK